MQLREVKTVNRWKVEIVTDERSIASLWIVDRQMRIEPCPVFTGGIAGVGTGGEYRNQGLSPQVRDAAFELGRREGCDAAMLFGIKDFYHKFGFFTFFPERLLDLELHEAERAKKQLAMHAMRQAGPRQITRLYNRDHAERTAEIGGQGDAAFSTILHYLSQQAVQLRREEISLSIGSTTPSAATAAHSAATTRPVFSATVDRSGALSTC